MTVASVQMDRQQTADSRQTERQADRERLRETDSRMQ